MVRINYNIFQALFQAMSIVGLGERGCALQKQRSTGMLPEEAKIFLQELFDRGEADSSEKVRCGMLQFLVKQMFATYLN